MYRVVEWTGDNHLLLHVEKTKEMVINFRRKGTTSRPLHILNGDRKFVEEHK